MSRNVALIYTRVSKFDEKDRGRAVSPEMQLARCKDLPALRGLNVEHFEDLDYSGKNTKRPGYQNLLERLGRGDVAVVAVYSQSRISRRVIDFYSFYERVEASGAAIVSATETIDTTTPMGRMAMGMTAVFAQGEREAIAERIRDAAEQKISSGRMAGSIPPGYRRLNGNVEIDPDAAPLIQTIFHEYATGGYSFGSLARWLNLAGHRPLRSPDLTERSAAAELFSDEIVRGILTNPRYAGHIELADGTLIAGEHKGLIDESTWAACVRTRQMRARSWLQVSKRPFSAFALSQILRCPTCGGAMRGDSRKRDARDGSIRYGYYACKLRRKDPRACSQKLLPSDAMDEAARHLLSLVAVPDELADAFRSALGIEATRPRQHRASEVRALEERIARLDEQFEFGFMERDTYATERRRRMQEIEALKALPEDPTSLMARREELRTLVDDWDTTRNETRRALVASVFESLRPTAGGGMVADVRPGWRQHAAAAAAATCEALCFERRRRESNPR